jgi:metallo-beta-lactamase class B
MRIAHLFLSSLLAYAHVPPCPHCIRSAPIGATRLQWNVTQKPFRIFGNTYYVGVRGLSSILVTSPQGHILLDGALPESAAKIEANVRALGFRPRDIKIILNTHDHFDHAGGIAALAEKTHARVMASPSSAKVLESGAPAAEDPQFAIAESIPTVPHVETLADGETVRIGSLALTAHFTPGHTPGGTSWTWTACEKENCKAIVYADSLTPVSAEGFRFSDGKTYPNARRDFEKSFTVLESLPCEILLTPHPELSDLWGRLERREKGNALAMVDAAACTRLVEGARASLARRLAKEAAQ